MHTSALKPKSTTDKPPLNFRKWNDSSVHSIGEIDDYEEGFDFYHDGKKVSKGVAWSQQASILGV